MDHYIDSRVTLSMTRIIIVDAVRDQVPAVIWGFGVQEAGTLVTWGSFSVIWDP